MQEGDSIVSKGSEDQIDRHHAERIPTLEELVAKITPENRHEETA